MAPKDLDLDSLLQRMVQTRGKRVKEVDMKEEEIVELIRRAREIFLKQPMLLELEPPLKVRAVSLAKFIHPFFGRLMTNPSPVSSS